MNTFINLETRLLRASDVAKILNISRPLAYRLMQTGKISTVRINRSVRVRLEDLERYIKENLNVA